MIDAVADIRRRGFSRGRFRLRHRLLCRRGRLDHLRRRGSSWAQFLRRRLRCGLKGLGLGPIVDERWAAPVVTSFALPPGWSGATFRDACRTLGKTVLYAEDTAAETAPTVVEGHHDLDAVLRPGPEKGRVKTK